MAAAPPPRRRPRARRAAARAARPRAVHVRGVVAGTRRTRGRRGTRERSGRLQSPRQIPSSRAVVDRCRSRAGPASCGRVASCERHVAHRGRVERHHHARLARRRAPAPRPRRSAARSGGRRWWASRRAAGGRARRRACRACRCRLASSAATRAPAPPSRSACAGLLLDHRDAAPPCGVAPSATTTIAKPRAAHVALLDLRGDLARCRRGSPGSGSRRRSAETPALSAIQPA